MDDKLCPSCGKDTLVEVGLDLVCLNDDCREVICSDIELPKQKIVMESSFKVVERKKELNALPICNCHEKIQIRDGIISIQDDIIQLQKQQLLEKDRSLNKCIKYIERIKNNKDPLGIFS